MAAKAYKEQNNNHLASRNDLEAVKTELRHETDIIKKDVEHIKYQLNTNVATKADLAEVKGEIDLVKKDISSVRTELKQDIASVRTEITSLKTELTHEISNVRTELKHEIELVKKDLSALSTTNKVILGAIVTLVISSPGAYNVFEKVHGIFV